MTATRQDFATYAGDAIAPQFTVLDGNGNPIDISTCQDIIFAARRSLADPVVLTKQKSTGGITLIGGGTTGQFQALIAAADTLALSGFYLYQCVVIDGTGAPSTVTVGRMQVGVAPAWTYSGDPNASQKDAVRFLVGDTLSDDQQIPDPEILFALQSWGSIWRAAAMCCRSLAARLSRTADTVQGDLHVMYANRAKAYRQMAAEYDQQAIIRSAGLPYAGGISVSDVIAVRNDPDRVPPQFNIGMMDCWIPVPPAGNEAQVFGMPNQGPI